MHDIQGEYGVPDWRVASAYPSATELTMSMWRWEFLRRNHAYRINFFKNEDEFHDESKGHYFQLVYGLLGPVDPRFSAKQIDSGKLLELAERDLGPLLFRNPSFEAWVRFVDDFAPFSYSHRHEIEERLLVGAKPSHLFLRVDLKRPLTPQLEWLKQIATEARESWVSDPRILRNSGKRRRDRKGHVRLWPTYLRVLDARDAGVSYGKLADAIIGGVRGHEPQAGRDLVAQAEALRTSWPY